MKYISVTEAAVLLNLNRSRVNVLARSGRLLGCVKVGNQYVIPYPPKILPSKRELTRQIAAAPK